MSSVDDFVERTKPLLEKMRAAGERRLLGLFPFKLTDDLAAHVIKACFYASMISDEGRWPKAALNACGKVGSLKHIASLEPPLLADSPTIAKLAHTVSDWCSLGYADLNGTPVIVGILPSMAVHLGTFVTQKAKTIASFKIAIKGPGNIDVICEKGVLTYKAGVVSEYQSLLSSKTLGRLAAIMDSRVVILLGDEFKEQVDKEIEQRLAKITNPAMVDLLRRGLKSEIAADSKTQLILSELIWRISEMRHGGILIVTDRPETSILSIKYPTKAGRLQNAVVRYWRTAHKDGYGTTRVSLSQSPGIELVHEGVVLRECITATAQLAGTDGAIVLGTDFSLHGFGAIIDKAGADESKFKFIDGAGNPLTYTSILQNKGSRHQSALSFVMREEGAVVFIISQDGNVTALENQGGEVRVEKGLRADGL
jgi:hypothetical protein